MFMYKYYTYYKMSDITYLSNEIIFDKSEIIIASFDPAIKNMGFRVERRFFDLETKTTTKVETIHYERVSLFDNNEKETETKDDSLFSVLNQKLNGWYNMLQNVDLFIIERQNPISRYNPQLGRALTHFNPNTIKQYSQLCSYFLVKFPDRCILTINPKLKAKILSFPAKLSYNDTKKHSVKLSLERLALYGDQNGLNILNSAGSKKDDLADSFIQIEAFFALCLKNNKPKTKTTKK